MLSLNRGRYTGTVVRNANIAGSIISAAQYRAETSNAAWHWHENLHISFVFEGRGLSESRSGDSSKAESGVFLYQAGESHRWIPGPDLARSVNIELEQAFFDEFECNENEVGAALKKRADTKFLLLKMQQELMICDDSSDETIRTLLLELTHQISRPFSGTQPQWVRIVAEVLADRWQEPVSLSELSRAAGVHPVTISRSFRRHFGCTLGEFQRKIKIEKSLWLIKNTDHSLTHISSFCGFSDQSHFIRTFKRVTGFLPRAFRAL